MTVSNIVRNPKMAGLFYFSPCYGLNLFPEMIDAYLNGPRTLSNERLSYLVISQQQVEDLEASALDVQNFDLLLCATHFLGTLIWL